MVAFFDLLISIHDLVFLQVFLEGFFEELFLTWLLVFFEQVAISAEADYYLYVIQYIVSSLASNARCHACKASLSPKLESNFATNPNREQ